MKLSTRSRIWRLVGWCCAIIALAGCSEESTNPPDDGDQTHKTKITSNETWCDDRLHVVDGDIVVEGAVLTICDGAMVQFTENSRLIIGTNGALVCGQDVASPKGVSFNGTVGVPGHWNMLEIRSSARQGATFCYNTIFRNGGNLTSMVRVGVDAVFKGCEFSKSANQGVYVEGSAQPQFINCEFRECGGEPIRTSMANAHCLNSGNAFRLNSKQYILVEQGSLQMDATWLNHEVPYRVQGNANTIQGGTLTIDPGVTIQMDEDARIIIEKSGGLVADGSAESILVTGATPAPGWWSSFEFRDDADHDNCRMEGCSFEYGGTSTYNATIVGTGARFKMRNCQIRKSSRAGLYLNAAAEPTLEGNTITECGMAPVHAYFQNIGRLKGGSYSGNANDYLEVEGGTITTATTFAKHDVPYRLVDDVNSVKAALTITSGATLEFQNGRILIDDGGSVSAVGLPFTITFTGVDKVPGSWRYIEIRKGANSGATVFEKCKVEFAGSSQGAFFLVSDCSPTIRNCLISFSGSCGVYKGQNATPNMSGNQFQNNAGQDVCN